MIDLRKTKTKFYNKKHHAKALNIEFLLSFEEYVQLLKEANITEQDIHQTKYHLARYNDTGPYQYGNCRFITREENIAERKISDKMREASRKNAEKMKTVGNEESSKLKRRQGLEKYWERLRNRSIEKRKLMHQSYIGNRNSQFGTCWITDGSINKKIQLSDLENWIKTGYIKGRTLS